MAGQIITPDYRPHAQLEKDVTSYLESSGFIVDSAPYHEKMKPQIIKTLQNIYTPTALYLRGRADRIAIKKYPPSVFEWEAKTHQSRKYGDWCIESLPLCTHKIIYDLLGIRCLYVYRDPFRGYDSGFWIKNIPTVRELKMPPRWNSNNSLKMYFLKVFKKIFPNTNISDMSYAPAGSGDPFVIIDESIVKKLPHWKNLIDENGKPIS